MGIPRRTKKLRIKKKRVIEYLDVIFPHWVITPKSNWSKAYSLIRQRNRLMYMYYHNTIPDEVRDEVRVVIRNAAKNIELEIINMFKEGYNNGK